MACWYQKVDINQYVWTVRHLLFNRCIFSLTRVIQKNWPLKLGFGNSLGVFPGLCSHFMRPSYVSRADLCEKAEDFETTFLEISWLFGKKTWQVANFCTNLGVTITGGKLKFELFFHGPKWLFVMTDYFIVWGGSLDISHSLKPPKINGLEETTKRVFCPWSFTAPRKKATTKQKSWDKKYDYSFVTPGIHWRRKVIGWI